MYKYNLMRKTRPAREEERRKGSEVPCFWLRVVGGGARGTWTWHMVSCMIASLTPEGLLCKIPLEFHAFSTDKSPTGTHVRRPPLWGTQRAEQLCSIISVQEGAAQSSGHWQTHQPSKGFSGGHRCPSEGTLTTSNHGSQPSVDKEIPEDQIINWWRWLTMLRINICSSIHPFRSFIQQVGTLYHANCRGYCKG